MWIETTKKYDQNKIAATLKETTVYAALIFTLNTINSVKFIKK